MSGKKSNDPNTFLTSDDAPTFGRRRSGGGIGMPSGLGLVSRIAMGSMRIMFLGMIFKVVVALGTMAVLFLFWPQILGMVMPSNDGFVEASSGLDGMTLVRWSWTMLKTKLFGALGGWFFGN